MVNKVLREYYFMVMLTAAAPGFTMAMYVNYLRQYGLGPLEIGLVNTAYFSALFIFEIPTGRFADRFGRKKSYITSCLINFGGTILYGLSGSFWLFISAELVKAVAQTFSSGAFDSWFVDRLEHYGYEGSLTKIFAKGKRIKSITTGVTALAGGVAFGYFPSSPWFISSVVFLICVFYARKIDEEYFCSETAQSRPPIMAIMRQITQHRELRFVFVITFVYFVAIQAFNMQWIPFFDPDSSNPNWVAVIGMFNHFTVFAGAYICGNALITRAKDSCTAMTICQMIIGAAVIITAVVGNGWIGFLLFMVHEMGRGAFDPLRSQCIHQYAESDDRATTDSIQSMACHLGSVVGLIASGAIAALIGIAPTWAISGTFLIGASIIIGIRHRSLNK